MSTTSTAPQAARRPVERYEGGMHHLAQPTMDPKATLDFYVGVMGAKITHCVSSRGWRPNHYDYIHMFLDLGKGDNIAMFYYFGAESPKDWPRYGNHHSFAAGSVEELDEWAAWLEANGHEVKVRNVYEVMTSIYLWDPNGRWLEIAANHRPLGAIDAEDAELTAQALIVAAGEKAPGIQRMWELKAGLIEAQEGEIGSTALIFPKIPEFAWIPKAAGDSVTKTYDRGSFTVIEGDGALTLRKPEDLPESLWWTCGTGGIKGRIESFDKQDLTLVGN
jgi:catechol 2,3-dioxygenase-like lactoylglutathione lyase family enzyme